MIIDTMKEITDLGNGVVVCALAVTVMAYLLMAGCKRTGVAVVLAFLTSAVTITLAKIICLSCSIQIGIPGLHSPSGHVALTTATYSMIGTVLATPMKRWQRFIIKSGVNSLIVVIALTRFLLGMHSIQEVLAGLLIGSLCYLVVRRWVLRDAPVTFNGKALAGTLLVVAVISQSVSIPAETWIQALALRVQHNITQCKPTDIKPVT